MAADEATHHETRLGERLLDDDEFEELFRLRPWERLKLSRRQRSCGMCHSCRSPDCGECEECLDKPGNGGLGLRHKRCVHRVCLYPLVAVALQQSF